jgi:CBS domain-containing protein
MPIRGTVKDYYIPLADYPNVREDATLRDVFAKLKARYDAADNFRSVLVLNAENHLIGTLGINDLLHALLPDYLRNAAAHYEGGTADLSSLATLWQEDCSDNCRQAAAGPIGPHVQPVEAVLSPGDPLAKALFLFATKTVKVLPVVEGKRVVGVVRRLDIVKEVLAAVLGEGDAQ